MLLNNKRHIDRRGANNCFIIDQKINQQLFYYIINICYAFLAIFGPFNSLTLGMDHAKLLDVLKSLPVRHAILPRVVCFATSRPADHATYSYTSGSG